MGTKDQQRASLEKIQLLLGELGFVLTNTGYYKEYGLANGSTVMVTPIFDKGMSQDLHFDLSAVDISGHERITIATGESIALDRVPAEARKDVMRMLAELAPGALLPKIESFILTMMCTNCRNVVSSFFSHQGSVQCLKCLDYE